VISKYINAAIGSAARMLSGFFLIHYLNDESKSLYVHLMLALTIFPLSDIGSIVNFKKINTENYSLNQILISIYKKIPIIIVLAGLLYYSYNVNERKIEYLFLLISLGILIILSQYGDTVLARIERLQRNSAAIDVVCALIFMGLIVLFPSLALNLYLIICIFFALSLKLIIAFGAINYKGEIRISIEPKFLPVQLAAYLASNIFYIMISNSYYSPGKQMLIDIRFAMAGNTVLSLLLPVYWSNLVEGRNRNYERVFVFLAVATSVGAMTGSYLYSKVYSHENTNFYVFIHFLILSLYAIRSTLQNYGKKFIEQFIVYSDRNLALLLI
jgi:hypothetical protein